MNNLTLDGRSSVSGGTYEGVDVDGLSKINGDLTCDKADIDGVCKVRGNVRVQGRVRADGVWKIYGNLDAEDIDVEGVLSVFGDATAESAKIEGALKVEGTFNVGQLDLKFFNAPKIKEIVGGKIHIRNGTRRRRFKAELIEGDEVLVQRAKVKVVRGDNVVIGAGCTVDRVEYRSRLDVHPKAVVKEKVELN